MKMVSVDIQIAEELLDELLVYADECGMTLPEFLILIAQEFLEAQDDL